MKVRNSPRRAGLKVQQNWRPVLFGILVAGTFVPVTPLHSAELQRITTGTIVGVVSSSSGIAQMGYVAIGLAVSSGAGCDRNWSKTTVCDDQGKELLLRWQHQ